MTGIDNTNLDSTRSVAPSTVAGNLGSITEHDDSTKEVTIENSIEEMSAKSSSEIPKNLKKPSYTYPVTKEDITYSKVPGENHDTRFFCQPVTESTLEVKPRELSSVYGVECVQILDSIAFDDDDVEELL